MTLLRIDSSLRFTDSYSRKAGDYFIQEWQKKNPNRKVRVRDVGKSLIPHLDPNTLAGYFDASIQTELLQISDELITELYECDELLITVPMYNFGIPSSLKAYFDLIVRNEKTFRYEEKSIGLLQNKKAYIISSMGGIKTEPLSFVELHLQEILNYIGISEIYFIAIDGTVDESYAGQKMITQKNTIINILKH